MPGDSARPHEFSSLSIFSGASTRATGEGAPKFVINDFSWHSALALVPQRFRKHHFPSGIGRPHTLTRTRACVRNQSM